MSRASQDLLNQSDSRIKLLDKAVVEHNIAQIHHHANFLSGIRNIMGPTPLTGDHRQMLRAIANEIDKYDQSERDQLQGVADELRKISQLGLR